MKELIDVALLPIETLVMGIPGSSVLLSMVIPDKEKGGKHEINILIGEGTQIEQGIVNLILDNPSIGNELLSALEIAGKQIISQN